MPEISEVLDDVQREVKRFGDDVKGLRDSMQRDLADVRKQADEAKKAAADSPEVKKSLEALATGVAEKNAAIEAAVKKIIDDAQKSVERMNEVEKKLNRSRIGFGGDVDPKKAAKELKQSRQFLTTAMAARGELKITTDVSDEKLDLEGLKSYKIAYGMYLRRGDTAMGAAEMKAMSVGSDPDGGYLVVPKISDTILTIQYETSPMRPISNVETISTDAIEFPTDDDQAGAGWVGETEARPATSTPQVGVQRIVANEMYAFPMVTQKLLEDAAIDVEAWLAGKIAAKFGRLEATAFVSGTGIKQPRGFLTYPNGSPSGTGVMTRGQIEQVVSGNATAVTADSLISLTLALKDYYVSGASWLLRRASVGAILLLKDSNGQYLWRPGLGQGLDVARQSTLLGYPVYEAADMPAIGAGALAVAFGNWKQAYTIVDRLGISTLRDPYTNKPFVGFYTRKRVGGDVTNFEALKLLVVST